MDTNWLAHLSPIRFRHNRMPRGIIVENQHEIRCESAEEYFADDRQQTFHIVWRTFAAQAQMLEEKS